MADINKLTEKIIKEAESLSNKIIEEASKKVSEIEKKLLKLRRMKKYSLIVKKGFEEAESLK